MRILHVAPRYSPSLGGAENYVKTLSEFLVADGHEVCVLTTTAIDHDALYDASLRHAASGDDVINNVQVLRFETDIEISPGNGRPDFSSGTMAKHISSLQPRQFDIVNGFCFPFETLLSYATRAAKNLDCPLILTPFLHSHPLLAGHFQSRALKKQLGSADRIICQTAHESDFLQTRWSLEEKILEVVGVGVDTEQELMDAFPPDRTSRPLVLFLGSNDRFKGAESVMDLSERFVGEPVQFVLAGGQTTGFRRYMRDRAPPGDNLRILGRISERMKRKLLREMQVFLLPSIAESFGQTYLQAWLRKKPVIGIDYGATACVIDHERNGLLVPFNDIDAMEAALRRYLENPLLRQRHGANGYRKALSFDWRLIYAKLRGIYREVIDTNHNRNST